MFDLNLAMKIVGIGAAAVFLVIIGDYLGSRVGRWKLAAIAGMINLVLILAFAIYFGVFQS
jgi:hypothetical protein